MNSTQIDELRDALRREAHDIQPVGLGADVVRRRGRRRRHRGRTVVAAGSAACLAGVFVAAVTRNAPPDRVAVGAAAPGTGSAPALEFRVVDGTVGFSSGHYTTADGVTYVLSTAPGERPATVDAGQAVYRTDDGEHWSMADVGVSWISDLAERDGVLYAVGTAPGATSKEDQHYRLGTSRDHGDTWSDAELPFDRSPPAAASVPMPRSASVHIARSADATVALLSEQYWPILDDLVEQRTHRTDVSTRLSDDGYEMIDLSACLLARARGAATSGPPATLAPPRAASGRAECVDPPVLGTIPWSDLGLRGPEDLNRQQLLVRADGADWDTVTGPRGAARDLVATDDGFLLLAAEISDFGPVPGSTLWRSSDARAWTEVAVPAGLEVQSVNGNRVVGIDSGGNVQTSTDGGSTWNSTEASDRAMMADAGPLGFAVITAPDALLFSTDGVAWRSVDLAREGAPGRYSPDGLTVGADHISVDYLTAGSTPGGPMKAVTLVATPRR